METPEHPHIVRDERLLQGEPIVNGTRTPVRAVVEHYWMGKTAEEIVVALPHLSLAQVFDALGFFQDHQEEVLAHIEKNRVSEGAVGKVWPDDALPGESPLQFHQRLSAAPLPKAS